MSKKRIADYGATILSLIVAIASAWMTIEWTTFDIKKEWPKLILSAVIAAGGYVSTLKLKK
jgi:hypothetical protein|tara:strand:- start:3 stop:185 length:183 start_codon:yes stop_codon:yes gene_type:complete